jgi:hypothetical protein
MHASALEFPLAHRGGDPNSPPAPWPFAALVLGVPAFREHRRGQPDPRVEDARARKALTEICTEAEAEQILTCWAGQPGVRGQVGYADLATPRYTGLRRNYFSILRLDQVGLDVHHPCRPG